MTCASTLDLLDRARESLQGAYAADTAAKRYAAAQRAALCAAAALVAARRRAAAPARGAGPQDPWALLRRVAPELGEWAGFFAATAAADAAASGSALRLSARAADDQLRAAEAFADLVAAALGLPRTGAGLPHRLPRVRESA
jgi:hypothetical protein